MSDVFITKYRPKDFKSVIGHGWAVRSLRALIRDRNSHAFLFAGQAGVGKTTMARITAHELGCDQNTIIEVDGATHTGIDSIRELQSIMRHRPFGEVEDRAIIVDECHRLSGQAWDSLLKSIEEPMQHGYWIFCSTNPAKVPETIKTRCSVFNLGLVNSHELTKLLEFVKEEEKLPTSEDIIRMCVKEALGSPRQALSNLAVAWGAKNTQEAGMLLKSAVESEPVMELCRFLINGGSFLKALAILRMIEDVNPESTRIIVTNYMAKALLTTGSDQAARHILSILSEFEKSYNASDGMAPLLLSIGRVLFQAA